MIYPAPCPIINIVTIRPIPNAVPKLHNAGTWYFLKNEINRLSFANGIIAGLSDKYVAIAPVTLAPGIPQSGFIRGAKILLIKAIAPNSDKSALIAPAITAIAIIKNTVFSNKSWAVAIMVLNINGVPIL